MTTMAREVATAESVNCPPAGRVLRAIIGKELRQNLVFVALIFFSDFILLSLLQWFAVDWAPRHFRPDPETLNVLLIPQLDLLPVACALAALLIGVFQPLAEIHFDRWSSLIHRPVSRSMLFWGRVLAGLILYGAAVGLPMAGWFLYASTSRGGQFFLIQYTYPFIADFFAAIGFYFAGLLLSERSATFYGSRVVPLAVAVTGSVAAGLTPWFWLALVLPLAPTALLCMAARGSYLTHGYTLRAPAPRRPWLVVVMVMGFSLPLCVMATNVRQSIDMKRWEPLGASWQKAVAMKPPVVHQTHVLYPDGMLNLRTQMTVSVFDKYRGYERKSSDFYQDGYGTPLPPPFEPSVYSDQESGYLFWDSNDFKTYRDTRNLTKLHEESHGKEGSDLFIWSEPQRLYFLFHSPPYPGTLLGTLGTNGFVPVGGRAEPFPSSKLGDERRVYEVDFAKRRVNVAYEAPAGEKIGRLGRASFRELQSNTRRRGLLLVLGKKLVWVDPDGHVTQLPTTRDPLTHYISVARYPKLHRWRIYYSSLDLMRPGETVVEYLNEDLQVLATDVTQQGDYRVKYDVALMSEGQRSRYVRTHWEDGVASAVGNPAAVSAYEAISRWMLRTNDSDAPLNEPSHWREHAAMAGTLVLSAVLAWLLGGWYRLRTRWLWALGAMVMGPAVLLTMMATCWRVRRVRCSACGRKRALEAERCERCGAWWEKPVRNGTEVFAG